MLPLTCVRDIIVASYMCKGCQCCLFNVLGKSVLPFTCVRGVSGASYMC